MILLNKSRAYTPQPLSQLHVKTSSGTCHQHMDSNDLFGNCTCTRTLTAISTPHHSHPVISTVPEAWPAAALARSIEKVVKNGRWKNMCREKLCLTHAWTAQICSHKNNGFFQILSPSKWFRVWSSYHVSKKQVRGKWVIDHAYMAANRPAGVLRQTKTSVSNYSISV